jgi:Pyruvate/2-oxoacid:ferredoxin oxidoreductase gamma subunit
MANPKYGSEKKGAPTNYYLTVAPSPIKVNCELNHVDVVLCCDPKAFTHTNPLEGLKKGGCLVWESSERRGRLAARARAPSRASWIREHNIRVFILPGFDIARHATDQTELQLRMQGNSFLGAFFRVSPFLRTFGISEEQFQKVVHKQYVKKFGRFGDAVVASNMTVMNEGFSRVQEIKYGDSTIPTAPRCATRRSPARRTRQLIPTAGCGRGGLWLDPAGRPAAPRPVPDARQVRRRIPRGPRLPPARRRPRLRRPHGRRHRRHPVQVRRPPRNPRLHRRELHPVHGVHHRLPRHRAAQHRPGRRHGPARPRSTTTSATPPTASPSAPNSPASNNAPAPA